MLLSEPADPHAFTLQYRHLTPHYFQCRYNCTLELAFGWDYFPCDNRILSRQEPADGSEL